jgi:hypothetical protein
MGRAVLALRNAGVTVVFGDRWDHGRLVGMVAEPGAWRKGAWRVDAVQDRYPGQTRQSSWDRLHQKALDAGVLVGNGRALTLLCRDKLRCQRALAVHPQLRMPPVEADPERFSERLVDWKGGFAKPRFGALGVGVSWMAPGQDVPAHLPGVVAGSTDPTILQWPVQPPHGTHGRVLRVLAQRVVPPSGPAWHLLPPVMRQSTTDRVVNAARGAFVAPAEDHLSGVVLDEVYAQVRHVCAVLSAVDDPGGVALELGIDLALDADHRPWVLEVNTRPRGRLTVLAKQAPERFGKAHRDAMTRPWLTLARLTRASASRTEPLPPGQCRPSSPTA